MRLINYAIANAALLCVIFLGVLVLAGCTTTSAMDPAMCPEPGVTDWEDPYAPEK